MAHSDGPPGSGLPRPRALRGPSRHPSAEPAPSSPARLPLGPCDARLTLGRRTGSRELPPCCVILAPLHFLGCGPEFFLNPIHQEASGFLAWGSVFCAAFLRRPPTRLSYAQSVGAALFLPLSRRENTEPTQDSAGILLPEPEASLPGLGSCKPGHLTLDTESLAPGKCLRP